MWLFWLIIIAILILTFIVKVLIKDVKEDGLAYERKPYLFDNVSELNLFKILKEEFGSQYEVFTQVHYIHLIQPKKSDWKEMSKNRSKIDRKSADFVLCDKEHVAPKLVIELDGSVHNTPRKHYRDEQINDLAVVVGLPILHIKTSELEKETVRRLVSEKLLAKLTNY